MKNLLIIGAFGHGKSSTGNKLLENDIFNVHRLRNMIGVQIGCSSKYCVADCSGFGESNIFNQNFLTPGTVLENICPIDGIVLVLKFNRDNCFSFLNTARQVVSAFDQEGLKSLMLLCIQGNEEIRFANDEFKRILLESNGYKYLVEQNNGSPIPFCLWDNFKPYEMQNKNFEECLELLIPFEKNKLYNSFEIRNA